MSAAPPSSAAAFATLLLGARYRHHVLCLQSRLRAMRSAYPLLTLHDDRQSRSLLAQLTHPIRLMSLGAAAAAPGRRLVAKTNQRGINATHIKLLAWRLEDYARIALLDADLYVVRPIDALLARDFAESVAAVPVQLHWCRSGGSTAFFNAGVIVLKPSRLTSDRLMSLDLCLAGVSPWRYCRGVPARDRFRADACEGGQFGDQSLLNIAFRDDWMRLPTRYNHPVRGTELTNTLAVCSIPRSGVAVAHVLGEPKPPDICRVFDWRTQRFCRPPATP